MCLCSQGKATAETKTCDGFVIQPTKPADIHKDPDYTENKKETLLALLKLKTGHRKLTAKTSLVNVMPENQIVQYTFQIYKF